MTLAIPESMQRRMVEWLVNSEMTGMYKGEVLIWYEVVSGLYLEGLREIAQSFFFPPPQYLLPDRVLIGHLQSTSQQG